MKGHEVANLSFAERARVRNREIGFTDTPNSRANRSHERMTDAVESTSAPSRSHSTASKSESKRLFAESIAVRWPNARRARNSCCSGMSFGVDRDVRHRGDDRLAGGRPVRVARLAARRATCGDELGIPAKVDEAQCGRRDRLEGCPLRAAADLRREGRDEDRTARRGDDVARDRTQCRIPPVADVRAVRRRQPVARQRAAVEPVEQRVRQRVEVEQRHPHRHGEGAAQRGLAAARNARDGDRARSASLTGRFHDLRIDP